MRFVFDWDRRKADANISKHGISFDEAMKVFLDRDALTIFDEDHSDDEDRWVTLGEATGPKLARGSYSCSGERRCGFDPHYLGASSDAA